MFQVKRRGTVGYEDLLREIAQISQSLVTENSSAAMDLMVLEAKIRDRFELMEGLPPLSRASRPLLDDELSPEEIRALIPSDIFSFESVDLPLVSHRKRWETLGTAAVLALITALGVLGLASVIQLTVSWLA